MKYGDMTIQGQSALLPKAKCGVFSRDNTLANGNQVVTGVGFKPSAVIFFICGNNSDEMSVGMQSDNNDYCVFNNNISGIDKWSETGTWCIYYHTSGSAAQGGRIISYDTDGFTIEWSKSGSPTGSTAVQYIAFK